jgi:hypothetical protein
MRKVLLLGLAALCLVPWPGAAIPPIFPTAGNGVFFDPGELLATVEFSYVGGCNSVVDVHTVRHFLGFDKVRDLTAQLTCTAAGDALVMQMDGVSEPRFKLVGGGVPGTMVALAGLYRDGYMAVHLP